MATRRQKRTRARARREELGDRSETGVDAAPERGDPRPFMVALRETYGEGSAQRDADRPAPRRGRSPIRHRPQPLWGSAPISEIVVVIGVGVLAVGLLRGPTEGLVPILVGIGLCLLAVLEFKLREHLSGFRSHSLLLALIATLALHTALVPIAAIPPPIAIGADIAIFVIVTVSLKTLFDRRTARNS